MSTLKALCCLLIFSFVFANYSAAQKKPPQESTVKTTESPDKVNPETKKFESKAGNFSINISEDPTKTRDIAAEKGQEPGKQSFWQFERAAYSVMYSAFNKSDLSRAFADMNSGVRKGVGNSGGKLISEKAISFGKYSGREFRSSMPNGTTYVCRIYLVDNVGYLLTATFIDENGEKEALEVLDSFKLMTAKK